MVVKQNSISGFGKTRPHRLKGTLGYLRHGDGHEGWLQKMKHFPRRFCARRLPGSSNGKFLASTSGGNQAHTGFHQSNVTLQRQDTPTDMHHKLATPSQGHALHRRNRGYLGIFKRLGSALKFLHRGLKQIESTHGTSLGHLLQIGAHRKGCFMPQHHALQLLFGQGDGHQ